MVCRDEDDIKKLAIREEKRMNERKKAKEARSYRSFKIFTEANINENEKYAKYNANNIKSIAKRERKKN